MKQEIIISRNKSRKVHWNAFLFIAEAEESCWLALRIRNDMEIFIQIHNKLELAVFTNWVSISLIPLFAI